MELPGDGHGELVYSSAQVLLLFADREEVLEKARAAALRAGCRIAAEAPIAGGAQRFDDQIAVDAALILVHDPSGDFDLLLDRVGSAARAGRMNGIVVTTFDMIDDVIATDLPPEIDHLTDPTDHELERALAMAVERTPSRLHDIGRSEATLLQQLSEDAARIASVLASLSEEEGGAGGSDEAEDVAAVDAGFVRGIIRARRLRDQYFRGELFADPAFDTLLDLYAARLEGRRVAVSSLCIAASVPATTALRWIRALTEKGLFIRTADPNDGRRIYIGLSDDAARAMGRYLSAVQKASLPAI